MGCLNSYRGRFGGMLLSDACASASRGGYGLALAGRQLARMNGRASSHSGRWKRGRKGGASQGAAERTSLWDASGHEGFRCQPYALGTVQSRCRQTRRGASNRRSRTAWICSGQIGCHVSGCSGYGRRRARRWSGKVTSDACTIGETDRTCYRRAGRRRIGRSSRWLRQRSANGGNG